MCLSFEPVLYLFSGKPKNLKQFPTEIYNKSFSFWKDQWGQIFEKAGDRRHLNVDNFLRQDVVASIVSERDIVGLICFSFFPVELISSFESTYLRQLPPEGLATLQQIKSGRLMTFEYLCVREKYRNKSLGVSIAEVLCHIGNLIMTEYGVMAAVGTAVRTNGMDVMAARFGFKPIAEFKKFDLDCALVMNTPKTIRYDVSLRNHAFMKSLWKRRVVLEDENDSIRKAV